MLSNYRKLIDQSKTELNVYKKSEKLYKRQLKELEIEQDLLTQSREIFQKASLVTQNHLAQHLSSIVTKALRSVFFEKDISFKVEFVERRNSTECDMWIVESGHEYEILESRGFGIADIVSFSLRVAYILLHPSDNVLCIDEPFRNLAKNKHDFASRMIQELSRELKIQFIIATHSEELIAHADKAFFMKQDKDGISQVKITSH